MPKEVKRNLGKRSASMQGDGEMVVGRRAPKDLASMQGAGEVVMDRRATRGFSKKEREDHMSSLEYKEFLDWAKKFKRKYKDPDEEYERFKIWLSSKEFVEKENTLAGGHKFGLTFFSDMTPLEKGQFHGSANADDPYRGNAQTPEFYESKYGQEVAAEEAAFANWVAKHNKKYRGMFEKEEGFAVYFRNKKIIEKVKKANPDKPLIYPPDLDSKMDQPYGWRMLQSLLLTGSPQFDEVFIPPSDGKCRFPFPPLPV